MSGIIAMSLSMGTGNGRLRGSTRSKPSAARRGFSSEGSSCAMVVPPSPSIAIASFLAPRVSTGLVFKGVRWDRRGDDDEVALCIASAVMSGGARLFALFAAPSASALAAFGLLLRGLVDRPLRCEGLACGGVRRAGERAIGDFLTGTLGPLGDGDPLTLRFFGVGDQEGPPFPERPTLRRLPPPPATGVRCRGRPRCKSDRGGIGEARGCCELEVDEDEDEDEVVVVVAACGRGRFASLDRPRRPPAFRTRDTIDDRGDRALRPAHSLLPMRELVLKLASGVAPVSRVSLSSLVWTILASCIGADMDANLGRSMWSFMLLIFLPRDRAVASFVFVAVGEDAEPFDWLSTKSSRDVSFTGV